MVQVVALASLVGNGIDIVAGDVVGCTSGEAERLVTRNLARPFDETLDSNRRVKSLHPETNAAVGETNTANNETSKEDDQIIIDMSQFITETLLAADTGVTPENVAAMVAADLKDLEAVSKATNTALKKLDSIGAAAVKKIRAGVEAIRLAAVDTAEAIAGGEMEDAGDPDAESNTNTDGDNGEANQDTAGQTGEAQGQEE